MITKRKILSILLFVQICLLSTSCSVMFAATKNGVRTNEAKACKKRIDFLKLKPYVLSSERMEDGSLIEIYEYPVDKSSKLRAVGHGVLDFWTCGLWEIAGMNIEDAIDEREYFRVRVYFDADERATCVELI